MIVIVVIAKDYITKNTLGYTEKEKGVKKNVARMVEKI